MNFLLAALTAWLNFVHVRMFHTSRIGSLHVLIPQILLHFQRLRYFTAILWQSPWIPLISVKISHRVVILQMLTIFRFICFFLSLYFFSSSIAFANCYFQLYTYIQTPSSRLLQSQSTVQQHCIHQFLYRLRQNESLHRRFILFHLFRCTSCSFLLAAFILFKLTIFMR